MGGGESLESWAVSSEWLRALIWARRHDKQTDRLGKWRITSSLLMSQLSGDFLALFKGLSLVWCPHVVYDLMTETAGFLVALTTLSNVDDARRLVRSLVDDRLVACGTILDGATSIYRWNGEITEDREVVVLFKTRLDRWTELANAVNALHPYDVPELLALPVGSGLEGYLRWVETETTSLETR